MRATWFALIVAFAAAQPAFGDDPPYFPPGTFQFSEGGDISGMLDERFSEALRRMREPSLAAAARADPHLIAYRFLRLPTWGPPTVVRIESGAIEAIQARWVKLSGEGGYEIGTIAEDLAPAVTPDDWDRLLRMVAAADFEAIPTRIDRIGADGEDWLIEGVHNGQYHAVHRWSPESGTFRNLGSAMMAWGKPNLGRGSNWPHPAASWLNALGVVALALFSAVGFVWLLYHWHDDPFHRSWFHRWKN